MPFFGLLVVFVLEYTRPHQILPFIEPLRLYAVLPIIVLLLALGAKTRNTNGEILTSSIGKGLLAFLAIATVSLVFAFYKERAWLIWQALLGYIFLFFMVAKLCDDKDKIRSLFRVIVGIHVWLIFQNPALLTNPNQRSYIADVTFLGDGNDFSLSVVVALPMCLYLYQSARGSAGRALYILAAIVMFGAVAGTQSRGAALALIAVVLYLWITAQKKGKSTVIIAVGVLVAIGMASEAYISRIQTITEFQQDGSAQGRIIAWKSAIDMANRRPVTGVGTGCFPLVFDDWYAHPGFGRLNAHSMYFQALGELGYPGVWLLSWILWALYRDNQRIVRSFRDDSGPAHLNQRQLMVAVNGIVVGFSVAGGFLSVLYYPHLYVIAGIVFAARRVDRVNEPTKHIRLKQMSSKIRGSMLKPDRKGAGVGDKSKLHS